MKKILIACLGNIFYADDAFGVEVAKILQNKELPAEAKVVDYGIRGIDLAFDLAENYDLVILVDTVKVGANAGDVFVIEPKSLGKMSSLSHDLTPNRALEFTERFGNQPKKILLIGCEPANLEFNEEMDVAVKNAVEKAVAKILGIIDEQNNKDD